MVEGEKAELGEEAGIDIKQINGKTNATYKDEADAAYGKSFDDKQEEARQILTTLYNKYAPQKVKDIDVLLEAYAGQEDELITSVRQKYENGGRNVPKREAPVGRRSSSRASFSGSIAGAARSAVRSMSLAPTRSRINAGRKKFNSTRKMEGLGSKPVRGAAGGGGLMARVGRGSKGANAPDLDLNFGPTTDDLMASTAGGGGRSGRRTMSLPPSSRARTSREEQKEKKEDLQEESAIEIKCLDTGDSTNAASVNTTVQKENRGIGLRQLKGRDRFIAFFQKYDPAQVEHVDRILTHGGKTEELLWNDLQVKYHVNQRGRLLAILKVFEPQKAQLVDKMLDQYSGREELLIAYYMEKYRPQMEKAEPDPKTWKTGADNTYQMLPGRDLGD